MQCSVPQLNRPSASSPQRGTSLIEVLVVLVILAVGILSIVRLFPAGFIALRNAENSTFADRLAQGALETLKKNNAALPDAIYMYSDTTGFNPNVNSDPNTSDINSERYISNETITVSASRVVGNSSYPPLYVLNYGPIYLPAITAMPPAISVHYLPVNGTPWTARTGDSRLDPSNGSGTNSIDIPNDVLQTGQQAYLVDYNAGRFAVPPAAYVQTFQVIVQGSTPSSPVTLTFQVPASGTSPTAYNGRWINLTGADQKYLIPDPDTGSIPNTLPTAPWSSLNLTRPFQYMGTVPNDQLWTSDPYEYKVFSDNIGGTSANMGVLAFNPLASGQNGAQALKARISYLALDWHILHEDHDVAEGGSTIRLTLNHLKKVGDVQFDQSLFSGLVSNATTPTDLMLLDLDTGQFSLLNGQTGASTTGPKVTDVDTTTATIDPMSYQISYQNGRLTFPSNSTAQHLRIFYAGDVDWAVAVQKAPSVYFHSVNDDPAPLSQDSAQKAGGVTPTPNLYATNAANEEVYFPLCDAGKTVEFDGITYTSGGAQKTVAVGTAAISTDLASNGLPYVNLSNAGLNASGVIADTVDTNKPITFTAVRGVSARAVVIWHERNRWRVRTTDTLLTQTQ